MNSQEIMIWSGIEPYGCRNLVPLKNACYYGLLIIKIIAIL